MMRLNHWLAAALAAALGLAALPGMAAPQPAAAADSATTTASRTCPPTLNHQFRVLAGEEQVNLCDAYLGKVVLIVNTASYCGYTDQFDGLEKLYADYRDRGLVVLGFPSNDFNQDPESEDQIREFCRLTYGVKFPMFEKTHAAQQRADPLYRTLGQLAGEYPRWNFHKYLLDREGNLVGSYRSRVAPQSDTLLAAIDRALASGSPR